MGGQNPTDDIYWGDDRWFRDHRFTWFPDKTLEGRLCPAGKPEDYQSVKLTARISERVSVKPDSVHSVGGAVAVYDAQLLVKGRVTQPHIIVEVFMR